MIYLVTGYPKSGSSAVMEALRAGGLDLAEDPKVSEQYRQTFDSPSFTANRDYHEPSRAMLLEWDFPRAYDGKALKLFASAVGRLAPHAYKVLVLTRHPEEIRQSWDAMLRATGRRAPRWLYGPNQQAEYDRRIGLLVETIRNRKDMGEPVVLRYREDLLTDPQGTLARLGWPIDVEAAAAIIEPSRSRTKLEALTVGV